MMDTRSLGITTRYSKVVNMWARFIQVPYGINHTSGKFWQSIQWRGQSFTLINNEFACFHFGLSLLEEALVSNTVALDDPVLVGTIDLDRGSVTLRRIGTPSKQESQAS